MKAIMISDKSKWCVLMMNGDKIVEVRKNTALYKATKKLIDEYGFADFYVYCSKDHSLIYTDGTDGKGDYIDYKYYESYKGDKNDIGSGKVLFKFRCYKVEEITPFEEYESPFGMAYKLKENKIVCCQKAQLTYDEYNRYLKGKNGYAIHINDLEIFDEPKELSEFKRCTEKTCIYGKCHKYMHCLKPLTKAPQNFAYLEVEE